MVSQRRGISVAPSPQSPVQSRSKVTFIFPVPAAHPLLIKELVQSRGERGDSSSSDFTLALPSRGGPAEVALSQLWCHPLLAVGGDAMAVPALQSPCAQVAPPPARAEAQGQHPRGTSRSAFCSSSLHRQEKPIKQHAGIQGKFLGDLDKLEKRWS